MKTERVDAYAFIYAYADVNDMLQESVFTVIDKIRGEFEENHEGDDEEAAFNEAEYIALYMKAYLAMKKQGIDLEVKRTMKTENMDFILACADWDLISLC